MTRKKRRRLEADREDAEDSRAEDNEESEPEEEVIIQSLMCLNLFLLFFLSRGNVFWPCKIRDISPSSCS